MGIFNIFEDMVNDMAKKAVRNSEHTLKKAESVSKREGRTLNDNYYQQKEKTEELKNKLGMR